jgi:hypothetical protein
LPHYGATCFIGYHLPIIVSTTVHGASLWASMGAHLVLSTPDKPNYSSVTELMILAKTSNFSGTGLD